VRSSTRRSPTLFSIGHGTRPIETFLALLVDADVQRLVDVRTAPGSRRHPQFGREALRDSLETAGIAYVWRGDDLGGFRRPRPDSRHTALRVEMFRGYADHMETGAFRDAVRWLIETADAVTAFLCAESDWHRCHRRHIADALVARGAAVTHLLDAGPRPHVFHPDGRVEDGWPVYDGAGAATPLFPG
jgi:uncharacterized protein (DUF488 family)